MKTSARNIFLKYKRAKGTLWGMIAAPVYDTLRAGTKNFRQKTLETTRKSDAKPREIGSLTLTEFFIETNGDGNRSMNQ